MLFYLELGEKIDLHQQIQTQGFIFSVFALFPFFCLTSECFGITWDRQNSMSQSLCSCIAGNSRVGTGWLGDAAAILPHSPRLLISISLSYHKENETLLRFWGFCLNVVTFLFSNRKHATPFREKKLGLCSKGLFGKIWGTSPPVFFLLNSK